MWPSLATPLLLDKMVYNNYIVMNKYCMIYVQVAICIYKGWGSNVLDNFK